MAAMRRIAALAFCGVAALMSPQVMAADEVEVLHWWTSGSEAQSAAELKAMMQVQGDTWKDFAVVGGGGGNAMAVLKSRVNSGNPPTAAQVKGIAIQEWGKEGVLANLDPVAKAEHWDALLPPAISSIMKFQGHYVAVPVNVHRVNWMWVNLQVFAKAGARPPRTWEEFAVAAEKIRKAGYIPVAHGGQPWQNATLFESIALGAGGPEYYKKAFVQLDPAALGSAATLRAFDTLRLVSRYMDKGMPGRDWNLATGMVTDGKAAMQFIGDWAKGEFTAAGKVAGRDYMCLATPETEGAFTFDVDSFIVFAQKDKNVKPVNDFARTVLSTQFQESFNLRKGSIPVRLHMPMNRFDECSKQSALDFAAASKSGSLLPSFSHEMAMPSVTREAVQDLISQFMYSNMSSRDAVEKLMGLAKH